MLSLMMTAPPILAAVAIDIDGTVAIQMVVFLFLLIFLHFTLFRPYLRAVEAREEGVGGSREEAAEMEARAAVVLEEYEQKLRQARRDALEVREGLRNQGIQKQNDIFQDVRGEINSRLTEQRDAISQQVQSAQAEMRHRAQGLAQSMVEKILPRA